MENNQQILGKMTHHIFKINLEIVYYDQTKWAKAFALSNSPIFLFVFMKYVATKRRLVYKNPDLGKGNSMILFLIRFPFGYYKTIHVEY